MNIDTYIDKDIYIQMQLRKKKDIRERRNKQRNKIKEYK